MSIISQIYCAITSGHAVAHPNKAATKLGENIARPDEGVSAKIRHQNTQATKARNFHYNTPSDQITAQDKHIEKHAAILKSYADQAQKNIDQIKANKPKGLFSVVKRVKYGRDLAEANTAKNRYSAASSEMLKNKALYKQPPAPPEQEAVPADAGNYVMRDDGHEYDNEGLGTNQDGYPYGYYAG